MEQHLAATKNHAGAMVSCVRCRSRKVKCDKAKPSCRRCTQSNQTCTYVDKCTPGPRTGHARHLHSKIESLERSLTSLRSEYENRLGAEFGSAGSQIHLPSGSDHLEPPNATGAFAQRESRYESSRSATTADTITEPHEHDSFLETTGLPPYHQLFSLMELYFKYVNIWLPLLQQESMFQLLQNPRNLDEPELVLLHAIALGGLRYWKNPRAIRQQYHSAFKRRILIYALENVRIRGVQSLAILTLDVLGDARAAEGMNLLALLAQQVLQLGLAIEYRFHIGINKEAPGGLTERSMLSCPKSWQEEEEARRLFWVIYVIDRYANTSTSSDFKVDEKTVNRPLPCRYNLWTAGEPVETRWYRRDKPFETTTNNPENLGSFSYLCEVARIMTRIHDFAKQPLDFYSPTDVSRWKEEYADLDRQLSIWLNSLPSELSDISDPRQSHTPRVSNWITLQSGFILAAVRLHTVAAYPPMTSDLFKASYSAMKKCTAAVTSMMRTTQDVISAGMLHSLGPPFAGAVWVVARLLLVHASVPGHCLDPSIEFFMSTLNQLGEYWSIAKVFSHRLRCTLSPGHAGDKNYSLENLRS